MSDLGELLRQRLVGFLSEQEVSLRREDTGSARGYYSPREKAIGLSDTISGDQETKTLLHETAHYLADHKNGIARDDAETVAESSAFVVLSHFGIATGDYSFPYVAAWAKDKAVLRRNLSAIQQTADQLITILEDATAQPEHLPLTVPAEQLVVAAPPSSEGKQYTNLGLPL